MVAKLAEAVEKSIPIIAETLEVIRNHMIFTQYHLLHNEMQKEVIHDWMGFKILVLSFCTFSSFRSVTLALSSFLTVLYLFSIGLK